MSSYTQFYSISIAAGGCSNQPVTGSVLFIKYCSGPVRVVTNTGATVLMNRGDTYREPDGGVFSLLTMLNDGTTAITVEFYAGSTAPQNDLITVSNFAALRTQANGGAAIVITYGAGGELSFPAATEVLFAGTNIYGEKRKQIIITNPNATLPLKLRRYVGATNYVGTIQPLDTWTVEMDEDICIVNPNGVAALVEVLETFYRIDNTQVAD